MKLTNRLLSLAFTCGVALPAYAQEVDLDTPAEEAESAITTVAELEADVTPEPAPEATLPAPTAAIEQAPVTDAADAEPVPPAAAPEEPPEPAAEAAPPAPEAAWTDDLSLSLFADGYAQAIWTASDPFGGDRGMMLSHRPFTHVGGLTLSFLGLDVAYEDGPIGATVNLRFGTSTPRLLGPTSGLPDGMQFVKQAFVSWRPVDRFQIDFGQFDTIYGAEVSESWQNPTYSRGALYNLVQPFYHTGFRVSYAPTESVTLTGLAVNGWNNVIDNNDMKSFGAQLSYSEGALTVSAGYLGGPEGDGENELWRHFGDVVVGLDLGALTISANADYSAEDLGGGSYDQLWGVMLAGRLGLSDHFGLALRGEYIGDPDTGSGLVTGTATIEVTPTENIVIRLDNRVDAVTDEGDGFQDPSTGDIDEAAFTTVLGVVVRSN